MITSYMQYIYFGLIYKHAARFFFTFEGLVGFVFMTSNLLVYYVMAFTFSSVYQLTCIFQVVFSLITFIRLNQANKLLTKSDILLTRNKTKKSMSSNVKEINKITSLSNLNIFYRFHANIRQSIFNANTKFGFILMVHILVYTPSNAFMVFSIIFRNIEIVTAILFVVCLWAQVLYM